MQNEAFKAVGLNYCYLAFDVKEGDLAAAVGAIRTLGLGGVNVTIPHKERVLDYLDEVEEQARLIGAVNTIVHRGGRLIGYNTDAAGFLKSLRADAGFDPGGNRVVLLGAGGAARAVAYGLAFERVESLGIFNRNLSRAEALARDISRSATCKVEAGDLQSVALSRALARAGLLVNATSAGMHPHTEDVPLPDLAPLRPGLIVYDLIYNPTKTRLLLEAEARGCRVINGIGMLIYQGALAFELWTGRKAPVAVMRAAAEKTLGNVK